jgi:hypothetical protein
MRKPNALQRLIIVAAALAVAVRLFFPATHPTEYGFETDIATTVLQILGMLAVFGASFYLASLGGGFRLRPALRYVLTSIVWTLFLGSLALGIIRFGIARSVWTINWLLTSIALAVFLVLLWFTRVFVAPRPNAHTRRGTLTALTLAGLVFLLGLGAHLYQGRLVVKRYAEAIELNKRIDEWQNLIIEGERIGPLEIGMSLGQAVNALGTRFDRGERLSNGLNVYLWRVGEDRFWYAMFNASNEKAVIAAYGIEPPVLPSGWVLDPPLIGLRGIKLRTSRGARFGDSPSTVEALYGKPSLVTPLKRSGRGADLRFHYGSIRTEFQFAKDSHGLLSVLVYAPGFSPDRVLRGR